ncbi:enoyl-CoA hydratase/isomerase family protein [Simiduia curdlanivorans]|uniref:Enoyl-CoA hydratase/isomerase family protein n=1 Tax=Simiduia curdlanivorans TaxID=1492769 RepID=A0ABV8V8E5_9GAMM|nr:enoyl-CoA hydratase/isomerase family protein [Simiduia curdlanivorans]MDN3638818.1 enoyl-CoA hydratase/isomerase family protein [Simiduia curdlanivorans]
MDNFETLTYGVENRVATIALNRPKTLNAINQTMRRELNQLIAAIEQDQAIRIVVIRAAGRGFSAGTDLSEGLAGYSTIDEQIQQEYKPILMAIAQSSKLYIAAIQGACVGIGAALAMSCDLAVMADDAYLYLAFASLGLVPDGGMSHHLVNALGYKKALQLFAEAAKLSAAECEKYGLINKRVASDALESQTQIWAQALAKGAPLSQQFGKHILRNVHTSSFEQTLDLESKLQTTCSTSQDSQNAIMAFFDKKEAEFIGR